MQQVLKLSSQQFLSGISLSDFVQNRGVFSDATSGVSALSFEPALNGVLHAGAVIDDNAGAVVVDTPIAGFVDSNGSTTTLYSIGNGGHLYSLNTQTPGATPTDLRSGTQITNPANGIATFQPKGGTKLLYFWQNQQIGTWDLSGTYPTGWTDNAYTGLENTAEHPVHKFFDRVYYGNGNKIGSLEDDGASGVTHSTNVLDFESVMKVTSITDDGNYLVVAMTPQLASGATTTPGSKIVFWDTNSNSWQKEWTLKNTVGVTSIRNVDGVIYALDRTGLYALTFNQAPKKLFELSRSGIGGNSTGSPNHQQMEVLGDGVMWVNRNGDISYFGSFTPSTPRSLHVPFSGFTDLKSLLPVAGAQNMHAGGSSEFYNISLINEGLTGVSAETIFFDMPETFNLGKIVLRFAEPLSSGDSLNVDIQTDEDVAATDWGTASFAAQGAVKKVELYGETNASKNSIEALKLILNFNSGNIKVKSVEVWGEFTA